MNGEAPSTTKADNSLRRFFALSIPYIPKSTTHYLYYFYHEQEVSLFRFGTSSNTLVPTTANLSSSRLHPVTTGID
jgi:hypothetical protein